MRVILCNHNIGERNDLFLIAGPCVLSDPDEAIIIARRLKEISDRLDILVVFKASFDKANRTRGESFRGPGIDRGLKILDLIRSTTSLPIITDIHEAWQANPTSAVADILQIPALLCKQTDLLQAAASTKRPILIKKGVFMSAEEMSFAAEKITAIARLESRDCQTILLCERGSSFGYNNNIVDMRNFMKMRQTKLPVIYDASHSIQKSGGEIIPETIRFLPELARAAVACGIAGVFLETVPDPTKAKCDADSTLPLDEVERLMASLLQLDKIVKRI